MKKGIHPKSFQAKVSCVCGNNFETKSSQEEIKVEICSNCHPFYTGKQKLLDAAGRVDSFKKKYANFSTKKTSKDEVKETPEDSEKKES